jgi:hypothetical protein
MAVWASCFTESLSSEKIYNDDDNFFARADLPVNQSPAQRRRKVIVYSIRAGKEKLPRRMGSIELVKWTGLKTAQFSRIVY